MPPNIEVENRSSDSFERINVAETDVVNSALLYSPYVPGPREEEALADRYGLYDDQPMLMIQNFESKKSRAGRAAKRAEVEHRAADASSSSPS